MSAFWIRLRHNWFRNLLAIGQVALAIAAVTVVLGEVVPILRASSAEEAVPYTVSYGARDGTAVRTVEVFTPEDAAFLREQASSIVGATWYKTEVPGAIRVGDQRYLLRGIGVVDLGFAELSGLQLVQGNYFAPADVGADRPRVALVSEALAQAVLGTLDVLGMTINVRPPEETQVLMGFGFGVDTAAVLGAPGEDVEIIGVFQPLDQSSSDTGIASPMELLLPVSEQDVGQAGNEGQLMVKSRPGMELAVEEEVRTLLAGRLAGRADVPATLDGLPLEIMVERGFSQQSAREARLQGMMLFGAMGMAAVVVSGIAMFTTTLTNLTQRTRYIGLSRALGATRARVIRESVNESALIAGLGGVIGVLGAYPLRQTVLAPLVQGFGSQPMGAVDLFVVGLGGVAMAMAVGAIAALYPAWTVSRMSPAEAWREGRM